MKHLFLRKTAVLLLAAALCFPVTVLSGCGESSDDEISIAYAPVIPESRVDENAPGEVQKGGIGDSLTCQNKVTAKLLRVVELDDAATTAERTLCAELTITNSSDKDIDCTTLSHFTVSVNGEVDKQTQDITAAISARKYYTATQSSLVAFNQAIKPGETVTGYVYLNPPTAWKTLELNYKPFRYYSNDTLCFTIDESKLTHYTEKL